MYNKARNNVAGINCKADLTAACLCQESSINFWYGIRDCSQSGCGTAVYQQVATWKDQVLCGTEQSLEPFPTPASTSTQRLTATPTKNTPATSAPPQIITYEDDGTTKYTTIRHVVTELPVARG
jgi:hypothetical protein